MMPADIIKDTMMFKLNTTKDDDNNLVYIIEDSIADCRFNLARSEEGDKIALWVEKNTYISNHMDVEQALAVAHRIIKIAMEINDGQ